MTLVQEPAPARAAAEREAVAAPFEERLGDFVHRFVGDLGAVVHAPLVVLGHELGLYESLAIGRATATELAARTGLDERYLLEWLAANAAGGYVEYDAETAVFWMDDVQTAMLADETSPGFVAGAFAIAVSMARDLDKIEHAFRTGVGVGWHEHDHSLFHGVERFFRHGYEASLVESWLPSLDGVVEKLNAGARVADFGCGHGASTIIMAKAFPNSSFVGFDYHEESVEQARRHAVEADVSERVAFAVATAKDFPSPAAGYDLVMCFDCLHDMGDPAGAAAHVRETLAVDGTWLIVEPFSNDRLEDNLNPVGRVYYSASTAICTPTSKAQEVGLALGAQAGEERLRRVVQSGGFTRFRRSAETPFNLVLEARP
jgi:SAM-dependent methyltransferase